MRLAAGSVILGRVGARRSREVFFSTAGIEVAIWVPPLAALVISFFTSMGGVSGAFLLLPFQVSVLGYASPSVSATNQLFNVIGIPGGVYRFLREGRMAWPLTWAVVIGTLPGVVLGALVRIAWLPDPGHFKLFAAGVLLFIGARLVQDLLRRSPAGRGAEAVEDRFHQRAMGRCRDDEGEGAPGDPARVGVKRSGLRRIELEFEGACFSVPTAGVVGLALVVGIVGGIYGIGGGAIIAPFFVSFFRLPVYLVAGAALMGTFVTSVAGVILYVALAPLFPDVAVSPDWLLGALFGLGGLVGMYLGARCQRFVPARVIKWMLALILVATAAKYGWDFI